MTRQKLQKAVLITVIALPLLIAAGFSRDVTTLTLHRALRVANAQIEPGEYQVSWRPEGGSLVVTFSQKGQPAASATAKLETRDGKFARTSVLYRTETDGSQTLTEIRLGGRKQVLVLG